MDADRLEKLVKLNTLILLLNSAITMGNLPVEVVTSDEGTATVVTERGGSKAHYVIQPLSEVTVVDPATSTTTPLTTQPGANPILWSISTTLSAQENLSVDLTADGITYTASVAPHIAGTYYYYIDHDSDSLQFTTTPRHVMFDAPLECHSASLSMTCLSDGNAGESHKLTLRWGKLL